MDALSTAEFLEDIILEGVANRIYGSDYQIDINFDDRKIDAYVRYLIPIQKIKIDVTVNKGF